MKTALLLLASLLPSHALAQECTGCTPLNDLGSGTYLGFEGGLYAGGINEPPPGLQAALDGEAAQVVPRAVDGLPSATGLIGMVAFTMSNANQEFGAFEYLVDEDLLRNGRVLVVGLAQGGKALDSISNPGNSYWPNVDQRVVAAGLDPLQVQVAWLKMAAANPSTEFPLHAQEVQAQAAEVLQILRAKFPNLRLAYFSSRTYGGNTTNPQRGEPLSYETAFAVKWLVDQQQSGDSALNWDSASGPVLAPLVLWGPYLWANGTLPRSDGLTWEPSDFEGDGVHPTEAGEDKVAGLLQDFFLTQPWYVEPDGARHQIIDVLDDAYISLSQPTMNFGSGGVVRAEDLRRGYLKFDLSAIEGDVLHAKLSLRQSPSATNSTGAELYGVSDTTWQESTITADAAPAIDGPLYGILPETSRGTAPSYAVTAAILEAQGGLVSFGLTGDPAVSGGRGFLSKEAGDGPRLVLTIRPTCDSPDVTYCHPSSNSTGESAHLSSTGSASISTGNLTLHATDLPGTQPAQFFFGFGHQRSSFGPGLLCVSPPLGRIKPIVITSAAGVASMTLNYATAPLGVGPLAVMAGDTIHMQCWFRDPAGIGIGIGLSSALQVELCP